eukprot:4403143-Pyramimonas_sp.AAC.1
MPPPARVEKERPGRDAAEQSPNTSPRPARKKGVGKSATAACQNAGMLRGSTAAGVTPPHQAGTIMA